jgi:hypothetical protein
LQEVVYYTGIVKRRHQQETHKTVHIRQRNFRHIQNFKTENAPPGMSETTGFDIRLSEEEKKHPTTTTTTKCEQDKSGLPSY